MDPRNYKSLNIVFCSNCLDGWTILYKLVTGEVFRHCLKCRRKPYDVYIGRDGDRAHVVHLYYAWLMLQPDLVAKVKAELRGKVLGCWCAPHACHGDVLAAVANG